MCYTPSITDPTVVTVWARSERTLSHVVRTIQSGTSGTVDISGTNTCRPSFGEAATGEGV